MMIDLEEQKLGVIKKIPTLVIAASCFDNIIAITGYSLMIDIGFSKGELWWTVILCFLQIFLGLVFGVFTAFILSFIRVEHRVNAVSNFNNFIYYYLYFFRLVLYH